MFSHLSGFELKIFLKLFSSAKRVASSENQRNINGFFIRNQFISIVNLYQNNVDMTLI